MTTMTIHATATGNPDGENSYNAGLLDGELDAISKLPAATAMARAAMADQYDALWAQGYADGYLNGIEVAHALRELTDGQARR
jgi:hypothetical protein